MIRVNLGLKNTAVNFKRHIWGSSVVGDPDPVFVTVPDPTKTTDALVGTFRGKRLAVEMYAECGLGLYREKKSLSCVAWWSSIWADAWTVIVTLRSPAATNRFSGQILSPTGWKEVVRHQACGVSLQDKPLKAGLCEAPWTWWSGWDTFLLTCWFTSAELRLCDVYPSLVSEDFCL